MAEYDKKINWQAFYGSYLKKVTIRGNELKALCPFHEDKDPSFAANLMTGLWMCHGCGRKGNAQTFLQELLNISAEEALTTLNGKAGIEPKKKERRKYTVEDYAAAKKLPADFLRKLGLQNGKTGIIIPYMDESGARISSRQRYGDTGSGPRFTWTRGSKVNLYGLWKLNQIREAGYVILVEGESDSQTLWFHEYPALGVPGASVFQPAWVDLLHGLKIYIFKEPDISGETFVRKICEALIRKTFEGEVYSIELIDTKDPSDLHCKNPAKFKEHWQAAVKMAGKVNVQKMSGLVEDVMPDAPVQLRQAPDWRFNEDGIFTIDDKTGIPFCVCRTPILLSRRLQLIENGQEKMEICYRRDGKWSMATVNRSALFQSRTITQLADLGVTVTSENARMLVRFLQALEAENMDLLERVNCVSQLGWHGKQFVPGYNDGLVIDVDPSTRRWLDAYHSSGELEAWKDAVLPCRANSIFRFILAAAFAAPMLRITKHRIFIVHNWGDTRSGKTAALKAALSAWGDPEGLITSFYATRVGLERLAGFFRDLPLGIDEKQVSEFSDNLAYMLTLGYGKVRGAKMGGLQASQAWRTIMLTTGEEPLSSTTSHSGVYTRTLEIRGAPFDDEEQARAFHSLDHYGHAGPEFIRRLVSYPYDEIKNMQETLQGVLVRNYGNHRLSSHISAAAMVATADNYLSRWLFGADEGAAFDDALEMALNIIEATEDSRILDTVNRAYEFLQGWVFSNKDQFGEGAHAPRYGFYDEFEGYFIYPQILREALKREGFSYRQVMSGFRERGWIVTEGNRYATLRRFGDVVARFVHVQLSDEVEDADVL